MLRAVCYRTGCRGLDNVVVLGYWPMELRAPRSQGDRDCVLENESQLLREEAGKVDVNTS